MTRRRPWTAKLAWIIFFLGESLDSFYSRKKGIKNELTTSQPRRYSEKESDCDEEKVSTQCTPELRQIPLLVPLFHFMYFRYSLNIQRTPLDGCTAGSTQLPGGFIFPSSQSMSAYIDLTHPVYSGGVRLAKFEPIPFWCPMGAITNRTFSNIKSIRIIRNNGYWAIEVVYC